MADHAPLFYALHPEHGALLTRHGHLIYATREVWETLPKIAGQLVPAIRIICGSVPLAEDECMCGESQRKAWHGHADGCPAHAADAEWLEKRRRERAEDAKLFAKGV